MLCGSIFHWYLFMVSWKLGGRKLKEKWGRSWGWSRIVSNTAFKSDLLQSPAEGTAEREGEQAAKPKDCLTSFTALSSYNNLKLPHLTEKKKTVFQGLELDSRCLVKAAPQPRSSCYFLSCKWPSRQAVQRVCIGSACWGGGDISALWENLSLLSQGWGQAG